MEFSVDDCIAFLTNAGGKALDAGMNERFKDADITRVQWTALYYIDKIENINQKELAEAMLISEPSTTNLINRLVQAGFVTRARASGARTKTIALTELGREKLETLRHIPVEFNQAATKTVSPEELEIFKKVLHEMVENIK